MASEWIDDEAEYQAALEGDAGAEDGEIRYGLTPLGALALDEGRAFSGFGPCAIGAPAFPASLVPQRDRLSGARRRRATPLFG